MDGAGVELNLTGAMAGNANGVVASNGARVRITDSVVTGNTTAGLVTDAGGEIVPFTENHVAGNPPGNTACQLIGSPVACPDVQPECPAAVCEAPIMGLGLGPCKRCRTKGAVTTCSGCGVTVE